MMEVSEILRCANVTRWHMVATKRKQNLSEHNFNVAVIADALSRELRKFVRESNNKWFELDCVRYALYHDIHEVYYGDTPSVIKTPDISDYLDGISRQLPNRDLCSTNRDELVLLTVKLADILEMEHFAGACMEGGDPHTRSVINGLKRSRISAFDELVDAVSDREGANSIMVSGAIVSVINALFRSSVTVLEKDPNGILTPKKV